jgi:hypothetical protein
MILDDFLPERLSDGVSPRAGNLAACGAEVKEIAARPIGAARIPQPLPRRPWRSF